MLRGPAAADQQRPDACLLERQHVACEVQEVRARAAATGSVTLDLDRVPADRQLRPRAARHVARVDAAAADDAPRVDRACARPAREADRSSRSSARSSVCNRRRAPAALRRARERRAREQRVGLALARGRSRRRPCASETYGAIRCRSLAESSSTSSPCSRSMRTLRSTSRSWASVSATRMPPRIATSRSLAELVGERLPEPRSTPRRKAVAGAYARAHASPVVQEGLVLQLRVQAAGVRARPLGVEVEALDRARRRRRPARAASAVARAGDAAAHHEHVAASSPSRGQRM